MTLEEPGWRLFVPLVVVITLVVAGSGMVSSPGPQSSVNPGGPPPYNVATYLDVSTGCGRGPCFGGNLSTAYVFDCTEAAATPAGCTATVVNTTYSLYDYNITIWYPRFNQSLPETNCQFQPDLDNYPPSGAWCTAVSSDGFVFSEPLLGFP